MLIPFSIGAYRRSDLPLVVLRNTFVEKTTDAPAQVVLLPRGGLEPYLSLGTGPIRGIFQESGALSGALFTVSGSALFSGSTNIGAISGSSRVAMAASLNALLVASGDALYKSDGATTAVVAFPDGAGASSVAFLGGYALAARTDTRRIYFTLDPATWDGLDYISTESSTANIVGFAVVSDQLWVFTQDKTYVFVLTGNPDTPIQAVPGRVFDKGCLNRDTIAVLDNTIFWVGGDGMTYRADNQPIRISDDGIDERVAASASDDLSAWTYPWFGHTIYCLNTAEGTFGFDAATQQWHELSSYERTTWRAWVGQLVGRDVIAGDDETGQLWRLSDTTLTDDGAAIERIFTILLEERGFLDVLTMDCSTGVTFGADQPAGTIELRTSRDGGMSWGNWRQATLALEGQYRAWPTWRGNGAVDQQGMVAQIRLTDARPWRVSAVRVNESSAGRSR